jgi:signal transduction histidine kinase
VRDNGPGLPSQLGRRVFEPFVTTKRARGGTGLGLSISKSIVEGYGGTIAATSEPGQGATFTLWLPQAPPE